MAAERWKSFFDPTAARGPRAGPDVGQAATPPDDADGAAGMVSVSALVAQIRHALAEALPQRFTVVGEISNFKRHSSGHLYFRMKDATATIDAAMFRSAASKLKFEPEDGLEVVVEGRVDVYDVRGQLQFYVYRMTPRGAGALELAFQQLCRKLRAEGLFDAESKKPLPRFPRAIGVVTSQTGAALRDIRRTLTRRWPAATVYLVPALVQGRGAAEAVAQAVGLLDAAAQSRGIDTIVVARGGGSLEDLWAFNEEIVARAIFAARTPIISGVGHEVDVTVADLVADVRAATPTAAAELAVPDADEIRRHLLTLTGRLGRTLGDRLRAARAQLDGLGRSAVFRDPLGPLRAQMQHVDELSLRLTAALREALARSRRRLEPAARRLLATHPVQLHQRAAARLDHLRNRLAWALGGRAKSAGDVLADTAGRLRAAHPRHRLRLARQQIRALGRQLDAMSYRSVLRRGFSVTRSAAGAILRSAADAEPGDDVRTELRDGVLTSRVTRREADSPRPVREAAAPQPTRKRKDDAKPSESTLFDLNSES